jgi:hypothetical protein
MKPEDQRIAIAESQEWTIVDFYPGDAIPNPVPPKTVYWDPERKHKSYPSLPDYLNDLNAIRGAIDYARETMRGIEKDPFWCDGQFAVMANTVVGRNHWDSDAPLMLITAPQYCEIYLRTLNLWKP